MGKTPKPIEEFKPFISDESFKLFHAYTNFNFRVTHSFIWRYEKNEIYNWKKDDELIDKLRIVLTEKEINYLLENQINSFNLTKDLLEHKIVNDIRENLNIKNNTTDTIKYMKEIESFIFNG